MQKENVIVTNGYTVSDIHQISIDFNGNNYVVIFGKYINGGFFCIPNWDCGGELADNSDLFWNTESITRSLKDKKAARAIAEAIAIFSAG